MEEVAVVTPPMVVAAALVLDTDNNNGAADDAVSSTAIIIPSVTSVTVEEKQETNGEDDVDVPTIITSAAATASNDDDGEEELFATPVSSRSPAASSTSTRKKRGAFGLFRAMFLSFGRSDSMKKLAADGGDTTTTPKKRSAIAAAAAAAGGGHKQPAGDESPSSWKSLVDGMRPLRLRGQELVEYYPPPPPLALGHAHAAADVYHDVILPPPSPARPGCFEFEEAGGMTSRYASAEDLHQMDSAAEDEEAADLAAAEGGDGDGDGSCPHAIEMQAEEFIAKFYEQYKSESFDGGRASE